MKQSLAIALSLGGFWLFASDSLAFTTCQPADVVVGQQDMSGNSPNQGDSSVMAPYKLYYPFGVYSVENKLVIADQFNHRVLIFNSIPSVNNSSADIILGTNVQGCSTELMNYPAQPYLNGSRLYIADTGNSRVLRFNPWISLDADMVLGQPDFTTNNAGVSNQKYNQSYAASCYGNSMVVCEYSNNRALIFNSIPTASWTAANIVLGQPNMNTGISNQGKIVPDATTLNVAQDVCMINNKIIIADTFNHRVLIYNAPYSDNMSASVVVGQADMSGGFPNRSATPGVTPAANTLNRPAGVFSDGLRLYIADEGNNRVLIYNTIPTTNGASADVVLGQPNMMSNVAAAGATGMWSPRDVCKNFNQLFVSDTTNNRVLIFNLPLYIAGLSKDHALAGSAFTTTIRGVFSAGAPAVKLINGVEISATGVSLSDYNTKITCTFNMQVLPGVFDLQITQGAKTRVIPKCFTLQNPVAKPICWKIADLGLTWSGSAPAPGMVAGMALGDFDHDGKQELAVANQDNKLYLVQKESSWTITPLPQEAGGFKRVLAMDGNQDEYPEIYGASTEPKIYQYAGSSLVKTIANSTVVINAMARGDGENEGCDKIYAASADGHVYQLGSTEGVWYLKDIGSSAMAMSAIAVGDAKGDGKQTVYAACQDDHIYPFTCENQVWTKGSGISTGIPDLHQLAIGDGDLDGNPELYGASADGQIRQFKWSGTAWVSQAIPVSANPLYALAISDGDNDGKDEVYTAGADGHVYQVTKSSGNWECIDMGNVGTPLYALVVGNGEGNNQLEVYTAAASGHVYQFRAETLTGPLPIATPTETPETGDVLKEIYVYPNPTQEKIVKFRFYLRRSSDVDICVWTGRSKRVWSKGAHYNQGWNEVYWDSSGVANGVYFYLVNVQAEGSSQRITKKLALAR